MQGRELEAQVRAELEQIMPLVSALTGLPTRWSGVVELLEEVDFKGKKRFTCDIQLDAALATQDIRWATLIHESLHCHSVGYNGPDYRLYRGWEEGVVEQLQRLFRSQILSNLSVSVEDEVFQQVASLHRYNRYINVLENLRQSLPWFRSDPAAFYKTLLAMPIRERSGFLMSQRFRLSLIENVEFTGNFSAANYELTRGVL